MTVSNYYFNIMNSTTHNIFILKKNKAVFTLNLSQYCVNAISLYYKSLNQLSYINNLKNNTYDVIKEINNGSIRVSIIKKHVTLAL